jgi:hypothetical protein
VFVVVQVWWKMNEVKEKIELNGIKLNNAMQVVTHH